MAILSCAALGAPFVSAQELAADRTELLKSEVVSVLSEETRLIPGTETETTYQTLKVKILEGEQAGTQVTVENDYLNLKAGDTFYLRHTIDGLSGFETYSVSESYRLPLLGFLALLFLGTVAFFGGKQGLRGLLALAGGFLLIIYVLLPGILGGFSPVLMTMIVASLIVTVGSYVTHGFNRTTSAAVLGMLATIGLTGLLAYASIHFGRLSGFSSDEAVYLNMNTRGSIDFAGLLLGGIMIGLLGVLYDVAIGQAVAVDELARAGTHLTRRDVYLRALRIGREHTGALVNTLAIAYVGASLPLLLLFYQTSSDVLTVTNQEIFATEIIRTLVSSIGLVVAVPITTFIAARMLVSRT